MLTRPAALAWGPEGHAIVADIAQRHLTHGRSQRSRASCWRWKATRLDQIASWPDEIRKDHPVDRALALRRHPAASDPATRAARDCPHGHCIVAKLPHFVHVLADRTAPPQVRLEALKWVVHLVGDIHQPLHNADHDDKGGNTVQLVYFGEPTNLHRVWDTGVWNRRPGLHMNPDYSFDHAAARRVAAGMGRTIDGAAIAQWTPARPLADIEPRPLQLVRSCRTAGAARGLRRPARAPRARRQGLVRDLPGAGLAGGAHPAGSRRRAPGRRCSNAALGR